MLRLPESLCQGTSDPRGGGWASVTHAWLPSPSLTPLPWPPLTPHILTYPPAPCLPSQPPAQPILTSPKQLFTADVPGLSWFVSIMASLQARDTCLPTSVARQPRRGLGRRQLMLIDLLCAVCHALYLWSSFTLLTSLSD